VTAPVKHGLGSTGGVRLGLRNSKKKEGKGKKKYISSLLKSGNFWKRLTDDDAACSFLQF